MQQRVLVCVSAAITLLLMAEAGVAQDLSVGLGASVMSSSDSMEYEPVTAAFRFGLSRLAFDVQWMSREESDEFFDSGQSRVALLNGQFGEYGRTTTSAHRTRESISANLLLRSQPARVTGWGGAGVAIARSTIHRQGTWTGCTGPWLPHCATGNYDYISEGTETRPQFVGGVDLRITRWVEVFTGGRAAMLAGGFDAGLTGGVRVSIVAERRGGPLAWATMADGTELRGRLVSRSDHAVILRRDDGDVVLPASSVRLLERSDSILDGALWGLLFGTLASWEVNSQGSGGRGVAGAMLAGIGIGIAIDDLIVGRRVVR